MTLERLLICTDLDRTLIPNGPEPESPRAREYLDSLVERPEVKLAFVSGRHRELVEEAIVAWRLPVPDFVIGDVGTTIYKVGPQHLWQRLDDWEREIAIDWGGRSHAELAELLGDIKPLRLQGADCQNRFKLSYFFDVGEDVDALSTVIGERIKAAGVKARLIWSIDDIENTGLLDILPARASKRHAIEALMQQQGFDLANTVFCGDSGNDLEVLVSPIPAVLVANARTDVKEQAMELAREAGTVQALHLAMGDFLGMNGNYSAGMLEGIAHFYPDTLAWMKQSGTKAGRVAS